MSHAQRPKAHRRAPIFLDRRPHCAPCGKAIYESQEDAQAEIARIRRRGSGRADTYASHVYPCPLNKRTYHLASRKRGQRKGTTR
jgi:hypothetical protein